MTEAANRIQSLFERHSRRYHFYVRDLRDGNELELGVKRPYPIASCFKLAVLMAAFESLDAAELDTPVSISPHHFSTGGGILNLLDSEVFYTPLQMIQLMMAASDGTSTDWLIRRIGLDKVQDVLKRHAPDSSVNMSHDEMVRAFRALPETADCKRNRWSNDTIDQFTTAVCASGYTHARDLASLALATYTYKTTCRIPGLYTRCLSVPKLMPRTEAYFGEETGVFSKTGSLGALFFSNDCGVIFRKRQSETIATFGYTVVGLRLSSIAAGSLFGEIGIAVLSFLGIDDVNNDWTSLGTEMMAGAS